MALLAGTQRSTVQWLRRGELLLKRQENASL